MKPGSGALIRRAVLAWIGLAAVMFANGTFRALVLQPRLGERLARQAATGSGVILVFAAAFLLVRGLDRPSSAVLLKIGALWLLLTLSFEFGMGLVAGASWDEMLADYDVLRGRLWPLIPLSALLAPWVWGAVGVRRRD